MLLNLADLNSTQIYKLLTQTLIPRPIAWIVSDNGDDSLNLAPFSYFSGITSNPPLLSVSVGHKANGDKKDTWVNIEERDYFTLNLPHTQQANAVTQCGESLAHGISEAETFGIELCPSKGFPLPRIRDCRVSYACKKEKIIEIGNGPQALIIGRIQTIWIDDSLIDFRDELPHIDTDKLDPLGRLGTSYTTIGKSIK